MGLSAWKQYGAARWALRVNPSSGNLHPTEAYVVWEGTVCHYAPREHLLEQRCALPPSAWDEAWQGRPPGFLVALTSIHWREAWKYGERAFRYCQHDIGHAIGALRVAADLLGWRLALLSGWPDADIASLVGVDRDDDFGEAEREEPDCLAVVTPGDPDAWRTLDPAPLAALARTAAWSGRANRLSPSRVAWPIIDEVAHAARLRSSSFGEAGPLPSSRVDEPSVANPAPAPPEPLFSREVILQRRSATGFNPADVLPRDRFLSMLARLQPASAGSPGSVAPPPPWDAIDWPAHVHLVLFVHRVQDVTPGIYAYLRDASVLEEWKRAMRPDFLWEPVDVTGGSGNQAGVPHALFLLAPLDVGRIANRLSCDQDIAEDGFFSLGMIARLEQGLREHGDAFYRRLFWECGLIGQVLYLEAERAGARGTGIGCFYDDPVHDLLGLSGHAWQSLYHFSMGIPVDDGRLRTEPGYAWEAGNLATLD